MAQIFYYYHYYYYYVMQFYSYWDSHHPSHNLPPMVVSSTLLSDQSSIEVPSLQAYTTHRVQQLIVQISSMAFWGDPLWSEDRANGVKARSI